MKPIVSRSLGGVFAPQTVDGMKIGETIPTALAIRMKSRLLTFWFVFMSVLSVWLIKVLRLILQSLSGGGRYSTEWFLNSAALLRFLSIQAAEFKNNSALIHIWSFSVQACKTLTASRT
jgi:hypothetical protein